MEYYTAIKNNKILPFVTIWIDLEGSFQISYNKKKYDPKVFANFSTMIHKITYFNNKDIL